MKGCYLKGKRCSGLIACEKFFSAITVAVAGSIGVVLGNEWAKRQDDLGRDVSSIELIFVTLLIIFIAYIIVGLVIEYLKRIIDHRWLEIL